MSTSLSRLDLRAHKKNQGVRWIVPLSLLVLAGCMAAVALSNRERLKKISKAPLNAELNGTAPSFSRQPYFESAEGMLKERSVPWWSALAQLEQLSGTSAQFVTMDFSAETQRVEASASLASPELLHGFFEGLNATEAVVSSPWRWSLVSVEGNVGGATSVKLSAVPLVIDRVVDSEKVSP